MNIDCSLVIRGRRIGLHFTDRDGRIALDHLGHHAAHRLDTQRKRGHVEQQNILDFTAQHTALDGGTDRDHFIGIDAFVRLFAVRHRAYQILDHRHA